VWPYAKRLHTFGVGAIAPAVRATSKRTGGRLPRQIVGTVDEIVARGEARMTVARPELRLTRAAPTGVPERHPAFLPQLDEVVPRVVVAELPRGRILGPYRAVLTGDGTLVGELSPYFGIRTPNQNPVFVDFSVPAATSQPGRVGVLAARGDASYYHYVTDVLPRLALLEELDNVPERLYVPSSLPFQHQLLELLGVRRDRIVDSDEVRHLQAETLVVPNLPDADLKTPPWIVSFLRHRLLTSDLRLVAGRRLYVSRGDRRGTRIVSNEDEIVTMLAELGFTTIDPAAMTVSDQIAAFAQAECIVAPHGAALTNLAFASSGASVVELFAPDYVQGCYWKICESVPGLAYRYLVGAGRSPHGGRMDGVDSDMAIDARALARLLGDLDVAKRVEPPN
jgi:capsular polysaccharide biosynthesis protein